MNSFFSAYLAATDLNPRYPNVSNFYIPFFYFLFCESTEVTVSVLKIAEVQAS